MTDEEQEARSRKWDRRLSVTLQRLSTGRFAMYEISGVTTPFWIGDACDIIEAYEARPEPSIVTYQRPTPRVAGLLENVDIKL